MTGPIDRSLLPGPEGIAAYRARGWYLSEKLLTDAEIDLLEEASQRFYDQGGDRPPPGPGLSAPPGRPHQRLDDYIDQQSDAIGAILRKPIIGAVAAELAQVDEIRVLMDTLIDKPVVADPAATVVPWHYDKYYWATCTSDSMVTAFIPFHDCGPEHGTICMVDGSHRWADRSAVRDRGSPTADDPGRRAQLDQVARANGAHVEVIPMQIPRGHMTFHHCLLFHGSGTNASDRPRRAISLHLQDGANRHRDPRTAPEGRRVPYKHDAIVRQVDGMPDYADPVICPVLWSRR